MRCPLCVNAGAQHKLFIDNAQPEPNLKQLENYWDEQDHQHTHDHQSIPTHLRCSNNHHFTVTWLSRCPVRTCWWNQQVEVHTGVGWPAVLKCEEVKDG